MQVECCHGDSALRQEWVVLQNQYDYYEKFAAIIKLVCIALVVSIFCFSDAHLLSVAVVFLLWLQEAMWKTFQGRIETRLLVIESMLFQPSGNEQSDAAMQFNRNWLAQRPSTVGLLIEYAKSALRPTVALHYVLLLLVILTACLTLNS
ncbi:hypothetical protein FX988_02139 [Paraglaciecola mesophila]|uniref:Uncharacterized protein n=1 Tax=Paraglaciecola mesophila TaxID=197222 RepID=A0A857JIY9_9ALTE|nr:hypothetical protein [Paraglaciecola mesophila]QHJ11903.1 hypothetical protein FX988_02139 [Paraglaciecola mesophila]